MIAKMLRSKNRISSIYHCSNFFCSFLQLKREFDNEWTRREVDALFQRCEFLSSRPLIHDLEDKDKILMEYYNALKFIYERVVLPCDLISSIHGMIDIIIFNCMGNVSLGRLVDMHSDAKEVTYDMLHNDVKFFR